MEAVRTQAPARQLFADYLSLTKPSIVGLLVATALAAMVAASHGRPHLLAMLAVIVGGSLAAGGAHAINCWYDGDIDLLMSRTRRRPIPDGRIPGWHALALGVGCNVVAFTVLWAWANLFAASLALAATLIYVFVYTIWLKRATPQNIVIGGAAGAIPPLVGWAAVTGGLDVTAISLFLVIFLWTPPHFWALAQLIARDYRQAGIPMMPVVHSSLSTKRQSVAYAVATAAVSLVPYFTGDAGVLYLVGAVVLGVGLVGVSVLDLRGRRWTGPLFAYSIAYLAALFTVLAIAGLFA
ncbi:MAG: protoheme IX farnesyltransferase [Chloroflexi bacterium]|nr:MAG: protoheme IX farnesyltransferase [Chloroflexota bacterium]